MTFCFVIIQYSLFNNDIEKTLLFSILIIVWTGRPGRYKVPRMKISPSQSKQTNTGNPSENVINDGSIVHSRLVCRSDLITSCDKIKGVSGVGIKTGWECSASTSTSSQMIHGNSSMLMENDSNSAPEYDLSQKIENFIANNSTPHQLTKSPVSVTSTR